MKVRSPLEPVFVLRVRVSVLVGVPIIRVPVPLETVPVPVIGGDGVFVPLDSVPTSTVSAAFVSEGVLVSDFERDKEGVRCVREEETECVGESVGVPPERLSVTEGVSVRENDGVLPVLVLVRECV